MPRCEKCGDEFGNAGAKASHENACDGGDTAASGTDATHAQPAPQPAQQDTQARQPQPQGGAQPATADGGGETLALGAQLGETLASASSGDPEAQAQAQGDILKLAGAGIAQFGQHVAQDKIEGIRRSKERAGETLAKADSYAVCPDCEGQIADLPERGTEFRCPHCSAMLEA
jgi:DNA-directed RNA polymerase subunit RPC12/RpoP